MMTSMVVTIDDILDQLWSENKRLLNELLFANKCLNILDELKTELNLIYNKFETQLTTEDKFNQLRHQLNNICDQRRDKGLHLNDVNFDEIQDKTNRYIENNQVIDNGIQLIDNIRLEENENVIQINQLNNTKIISYRDNKINDNLKLKTNYNKVIDSSCGQQRSLYLKPQTISSEKYNEIIKTTTKKSQPKKRKKKTKSNDDNKQELMTTNPYLSTNSDCHDSSRDKSQTSLDRKKLGKQRANWSKTGGYKCLNSDCQMTFKTICEYRKHHSICAVNCPQCGRKYRSQIAYINHQMREHGLGGEFPYKCDYIGCNYQTAEMYAFRKHQSITHSMDRTFVCDIDGCNRSFKTSVGLNYHRDWHLDKKYVCNVDGYHKQFKQKHKHTRHLAEHMSEPTLQCPEKDCRKLFYADKEIYRHRVDDHKRKFRPNRKRLYHRCDWPGCDYYGTDLNPHKLVHTGEKNFRCDWPECGKRFGDKHKLKLHLNIHNNVKPFACRWPGCEYRCAHHSNIYKHMKQVHQKQ